ncbi:hypothetical protein HPB50_026530 [Hyalomma asiaticum]|uniref:Uncharacterized protein n=1 Tax=Hyalomma asiaticum TaxID=266040 RepID=A0ACB7RWM9_HYAAI|nr:hypothetical protein HPB50_026530 [Hyalomma asiaticum]
MGIELLQMDPLTMPNISMPIPILGDIKLYDGSFTGLSTIQRTGPNWIRADDNGLSVMLGMGIGKMDISCGIGISTSLMSQGIYMSMNTKKACISAHVNE